MKRVLALLFLIVLIGGSALGFMFMMAYQKASKVIEDQLNDKINLIDTRPTLMYARDGKTLLYRASVEYRTLIKDYSELPETVVNATLAAEDKRFFEHKGVDPVAVLRSTFRNVKEGRQSQGASTITMQLVKRLFTSPEKSFSRKLEDAALAIQLETKLTKQQILVLYLNQIFYGNGAYGIRAAADVYFGKRDLDQLTAAEAAMLARCVRRPSDENPYADMKTSTRNRDVVLRVMLEEGMITQSAYDKGIKEKPKLRPRQSGSGERILYAPYFTRYVLDQIKHDYPKVDLGTAGWTIYTTLDPSLQDVTEQAVQNLVEKYRRSRVSCGAFVLLDNQGQILAMQGNLDWKKDQFNIITQGRRQAGSSFKPFIYSAALSTRAISPGDRISNEPFEMIEGWHPHNSGGRVGGSYSIPAAIANSINLCAIWTTYKVGPETAASYCRDVFGFTSKIDPVMSMALGTNSVAPLEMAQGYSVFQLHGNRFRPYGIARIDNSDKTTVLDNQPHITEHILDERVASYMDSCLRGVVTGGTATRAQIIKDARGKTGTTNDAKDAWFCGYTNNLLGIGWIGNVRYDKDGTASYEPMADNVFGGKVTVLMWNEVMKAAQKKRGYGVALSSPTLDRERDDFQVEGHTKPADAPPTDDVNPTVPDPNTVDPGVAPKPGGTKAGTADIPTTHADPNEDVPPKVEPPEREPPARTTPPVSDDEVVEVEVCAETGQKATVYCPETVTRRFKKGQAPKRWCRKHTP